MSGSPIDRPTNEYLRFDERWPHDRKTAVVIVRATRSGASLGHIAWYGPWRQYAFHPVPATTFNAGCLETIVAYIRSLMEERRSSSGADTDALVLDALTLQDRVIEANRLFHMVLRQAQGAYAAGLRDGPEECMEWLGNALRGPGVLPLEGADPDWYAADAWTQGPPWQKVPAANATLSEPAR